MRDHAAAGILAMACLAHAHPATGQTGLCPGMQGADASLAVRSSGARLADVRGLLDHDARRSRTWTLLWTVGFGGLALGGGVAAGIFEASGNHDEAFDQAVGAGASLVGVGFSLISQRRVTRDQTALEARVAASSALDPCAVLADAEAMLVRDAADESAGRAWYVHALGIGFNLALSAFLGLGYGHWRNAVVDLAVGTALSELQVFTQPVGLVDGLSRYRAGMLAGTAPTAILWSVQPMWGSGLAGLSVAASL